MRTAGVEDWPGIAALLGRRPDEGPALRQYLEREYDPGLAWVATDEAAARAPDRQPAVGGPGEGAIIGAAVAGLRRPPPGASPPANAVSDQAPAPPSAPRASDSAPSTGRGLGGRGAGGPARSTQPRGPASGRPSSHREGRLVFLGVQPSHRRRGIGDRLLETALAGLQAGGAGRVTAEVEGTQAEALALLRRAGFAEEGQSLALLLPAAVASRLAGTPPPPGDALRPLILEDVPHLSGLLIQLGIERAPTPHDDLPSLTPAQLRDWLQRPATVAFAVWERDDPQTPLGLAWATRRPEDAVLRFVGVQDDARRRGTGRALLGALLAGLGCPRGATPGGGGGAPPLPRPLRAALHDPGAEQEFFRRLGFEAEHVTYRLGRTLGGGAPPGPRPTA